MNPLNKENVMSVADARESFSRILRSFRHEFDPQPIVVGAHRKPEAVIVPYSTYISRAQSSGSTVFDLSALQEMSEVLHKLAAMNNIDQLGVFGPILTRALEPDEHLDLVVVPRETATYFDLVQCGTELELVLRRFVNIVNRDGLHPVADAEILETTHYLSH